MAAAIDLAVILAAVAVANGALMWRLQVASETDQSWYFILFGPANAIVAVSCLACTPIFRRLSRGTPARIHVTLSIAIPVSVIVCWALFFMRNAP